MGKYQPDWFKVNCWDGSLYSLKVGFTRPVNAPSHKVTQADMDRKTLALKINMDLLTRYPYKTWDEVLDALSELGFNLDAKADRIREEEKEEDEFMQSWGARH